MINTANLCETVGLEPDAFHIIFKDTEGYNPFIASNIGMLRQITPDTLDNENMFLYEAEEMIQKGLALLKSDLNLIQRFRATHYGPKKKK